MGRKLTFCKEEALQTLMQLFWSKGYSATSIRDIASALNVPIASIYHSFGDKKSIYIMTLNTYFDCFIEPFFAELLTQPNANDALLCLLYARSNKCDMREYPAGCYLVKTATELPNLEPELADIAKEKITLVQSYIHKLVAHAKQQNQIIDTRTNEEITSYLFGIIISIETWACAGATTQMINNHLDIALQPIKLNHSNSQRA